MSPRHPAIAVVIALMGIAVAACGVEREPRRTDADARTSVHRRHHSSADDDETPRSTRRVFAKNRFVWIRRSPDETSEWVGYITLGESVAVREGAAPARDDSNCREWVGVEPEGWVCLGRNATLDPTDEVVVHLQEHAANRSSPWPYDYARSVGAARYRSLPSERDERVREGDVELLRKRIDQARLVDGPDAIRAIDPRLAGVELGMTGASPPTPFEPPPSVLESDEDVSLGSTIAYSYEFDYHGRAWLLTWDHGVVPEARVKKYPRSSFHGVARDHGLELPLAFTKKRAATKLRRGSDGTLTATSDAFPPQTAVPLTPDAPVVDTAGKAYRATREPGVFVAESDVVLVTPIGEPPAKLSGAGRATWIEVSTVGGYLVAYEGDQPVYATLISAGRARMQDAKTMAPISSTPNGTFSILSKLETTTMRPTLAPETTPGSSEAPTGTVHAEVMRTQVFHEGFALHGAYWHDDWGDRKSAGCVNLSPIDAKWLFDWSEPAVPRDWHARRTMPGDPSTLVVIHP